jgi:aspartate/glutamate racemase
LHGLEVLIPGAEDRRVVHDIIYRELVAGQVLPASRDAYRGIIARLVARGAEAIILGCTEIMLLVWGSTAPCRCSTRQGCMRWPQSSGRWRRSANRTRRAIAACAAYSPA